jgi:hypothetical protein
MELQQAAGLGKQKTMSAVAWVLVLVAYGLGVGTGAFVFGNASEPAGEAPSPSASSREPAAPDEAELTAVDAVDAAGLRDLAGPQTAAPTPAPGATPAPNKGTAPGPARVAAPSPRGQGLLQGLRTNTQAAGPSADTQNDKSAQTAAAAQLSSADIQRTVSANTAGVRRACWQRALDGRDPSSPSTARVNVTMTVAPNGRVTTASSGGDPPGYPGLSSCITRRVRGWTFPRSGAPTTVNVPFVFAAQ